MNKKILVSALAAAGLAAAPMMASATEVLVFGHAGVNLSHVSGDVDSEARVNDPARGRFGIRATEDLGNGMRGIAQFEYMSRLARDSAAEAENAKPLNQMRETFVGLEGGFGRIAAGRFNGAYKQTGGTGWDPFVTTELEQRGSTAGAGAHAHNAFISRAIEYRTPDLGGFRAIAQYSLQEEGQAVQQVGDGDYSVAASYKIGDVELIAAHSYQDVSSNSNTKIGVRWASGPVAVFATAEDTELGDLQGDLYNVGVTYRMGKNELYGHFGLADLNNNDEVTAVTLGVTHRMTRTFRVYGGAKFENIDFAGAGDIDVRTLMVGMRKDF